MMLLSFLPFPVLYPEHKTDPHLIATFNKRVVALLIRLRSSQFPLNPQVFHVLAPATWKPLPAAAAPPTPAATGEARVQSAVRDGPNPLQQSDIGLGAMEDGALHSQSKQSERMMKKKDNCGDNRSVVNMCSMRSRANIAILRKEAPSFYKLTTQDVKGFVLSRVQHFVRQLGPKL